MNKITYEEFIRKVEEYNPDAVPMVKKAYEYADVLHQGQFRQSGEPYITHPLNVAYILSELHADQDTLCAGLLHDTLEDTPVTKEEITRDFNSEVAKLVDGVTKISKMQNNDRIKLNNANTRKIITSCEEDIRIIIIKLADRLHNMRTLEFKSEFKQKENSLETLSLYVPFAYHLGAYGIKNELEDISFSYLDKDKYKEIEEIRNKIEEDSKPYLLEMLKNIKGLLEFEGIPNDIKLITKNIYGIYKRLQTENNIDNIHDLFSLITCVDSMKHCYIALGLVHSQYRPVNEYFKDYLYNPKTNLYKSIHTTVFGSNDIITQFQIRTFIMNKIAMNGMMTYWDIKKGDARKEMQSEIREKLSFFEELRELNLSSKDDEEFLKKAREEAFSEKVYVYTPKGKKIGLPIGSTPIDFAYYIHSEIGNTMVKAIVNDNEVSFNYELKNNDRVKIITDSNQNISKEQYINQVRTTKAKRYIKSNY